jgi:hypothetical protein
MVGLHDRLAGLVFYWPTWSRNRVGWLCNLIQPIDEQKVRLYSVFPHSISLWRKLKGPRAIWFLGTIIIAKYLGKRVMPAMKKNMATKFRPFFLASLLRASLLFFNVVDAI